MTKTKTPILWNPADGDALQGDVCLFRIPDGIGLDKSEAIEPRDGRLILAEGEVTGHHHAIGLGKYLPQPTQFHDAAQARATPAKDWVTKARKAAKAGTARLYRGIGTIAKLRSAGELTTDTLAIGLLVVEGGNVNLGHDEHDTITIPPGAYYVGNQREWDAAEERRIAD